MTAASLAPLLMILSGSLHAIVNAILKSGRNKMAGRAIIDGSAALMLLPALALVPLPAGAWGWLAASCLVHLGYLFALVRAFEGADLSASYPVLRGTAPLVTALVTLGLLGESATAADVAGIALIGIGMFAMVVGRHIGAAALRWSLLTGILIATYTVIDARGVRAAPAAASYIVWFFVLSGVSIAVTFSWLSRVSLVGSVREQWRPGLIAGMLSIATYGLALYALSLGRTATLAALRETGMVTALLISIFVLGERVTFGRIAGILAMLAGAMLILAS